MNISVTDPIDKALKRTGRVLFKPFHLGKWFVLGFCAFLAHCGESGNANFQSNVGGGGPGGGGPGGFAEFVQWVEANIQMIVGMGVALMGLGLLVITLVFWLQSRGKFMFLDGVVHNRAAVVEPWKTFKPQGNSLFGFKMLVVVLLATVVLLTLGIVGWLVWPDMRQEQFTIRSGTAIGLTAAVAIPLWLGYVLLMAILNDFIVPTMYLHNLRIGDAWTLTRLELFRGNLWAVVLFYLMRIVLGIAIAIIATVATCLTCCVTAVPYLGTVILLPLFVFTRCYSLFFIEQFGSMWQIFPRDEDHPQCSVCGYDLRGNPDATHCPECGAQIIKPLPKPTGDDAGTDVSPGEST